MTDQKRKLKKKQKTDESSAILLNVGETFDVASAKEGDLELDWDSAQFTGKKGQAGTRTKKVE